MTLEDLSREIDAIVPRGRSFCAEAARWRHVYSFGGEDFKVTFRCYVSSGGGHPSISHEAKTPELLIDMMRAEFCESHDAATLELEEVAT